MDIINQAIPFIASKGALILGAFIVFLIGRFIANKVGNGVERSLSRSPNSDPTLNRFFGSIVKYIIFAVAMIAALTIIGVNTGSFSAMIVGLGAAMAFILQGSLSNIAAGVMMMIFRPFKQGDIIEAGGVTGTVESITMTATRLLTPDNVVAIIANSKIWGGTVHNHTAHNIRRIDRNFGIAYDADIDKAQEVITKAALAIPQVLSKPEPWIKVVELGESTVDLQLRIWCKTKDYKPLTAELSQPIKEALEKAGFTKVYPTEIKLKKDPKAANRKKKLQALKS